MGRKPDETSPAAVRAELARVLGSPQFDASERNREFLAFVVEEALAGRACRIKGYTIATEIFGREPNFDPQLDSIVRIEAGRLRRSLERYYLTDGRGSHLRIEIPRGGYVPVFGAAPPAPAREAAWHAPSVLVETFEEEGDPSVCPSFARGFARSLIVALARFSNLRVFGADAVLGRPGGDPPGAGPRVDYVVTGQTALAPDRFQVDVLLVAAASGRIVWAGSFERRPRPAEVIPLRNDVANQVARAIAQPYGAIQCDRGDDAKAAAPEVRDGSAAVALFYAYWRTFDGERIEPVRLSLERAIDAEPDYADARACLSLVYCNAHRFRHPIGLDADLPRRALELATQAVELAPNAAWGHYALGLARWFAGDFEAGIRALETGRALNPNDTTILADLGQRYAMRARWDGAMPLLAEAYATNPAQPGGYRVGVFLFHYAHGRFAAALEEARLINAPRVVYGHVAEAAAAAELGRRAEATAAVAALRALDPDYGARLVDDLMGRGLAPGLVDALAASLAKAGLAVRRSEPAPGGGDPPGDAAGIGALPALAAPGSP